MRFDTPAPYYCTIGATQKKPPVMCSGYKASSSFLRLVTPAPSCCRSNTHTKSHLRYVQRLRGKQQLPAPCHTCSKLLQEQHTQKASQVMCSGCKASNSFRRIHLPQAAAEAALKPAIHSIINPYNAYNCALRLDVSAPRCWSSADERIRLLALKRLCVTYN